MASGTHGFRVEKRLLARWQVVVLLVEAIDDIVWD